MSARLHVSVVVAALLAAACARSERAPAPANKDAAATEARVRVDGVPARGDVLWIADDRVVATAPLVDGVAKVPVGAGAAQRALVRIEAPALGVREVSAGAAIVLDVPRREVATVRGRVVVPTGVDAPWVELGLTPRLAAVPPRLVLAEGTTTSIRGVYVARRLTTASFEERVLTGTWEFRVDRMVDAPLGAGEPTLGLERLTASSGAAAVENHGGYQLAIDGDVEVEARLRVQPSP
jgi:hypothetical protein